MARAKEKTIWQVLSAKNPESITLEEVKNAMRGVNPNNTSYSGKGTPLCYAVRTGRMDIIRYFVEELKVNVAKPKDYSPLKIAIAEENIEMVKYFLSIDPFIVEYEYQAQCVETAIGGENLEILKILVEEKKFFVGNKDISTPLCSAVYHNLEEVKYLIAHGAVPSDKVLAETIKCIYYSQSDEPEDNSSNSQSENFEIFKFLLEQPNIKYDLSAALMIAAEYNSFDCMEYLLAKGATIETTEDKYGHRTPLLFTAVANNDFEMVKFLVSQGADIREKNDKGETLLEYIWWSKEKLPILKYIVEELHYFDETNKDYCLCGSNSLAVLKYLTKQGITYRQTIHSEKFSWLFQEMVRYGDLPLVKYLVEVLNFPIDMSSKGMGILCAMETTWNERNCKSFLYLIEKGAPVTVETGSIVSNPSMLDVAIGHVEDKNALLEDKKNIIKALLRKGIQCRENIANLSRAMFLCECIAEIQNELSSTQSPQISIEILQALLKGKDKKVIKNGSVTTNG